MVHGRQRSNGEGINILHKYKIHVSTCGSVLITSNVLQTFQLILCEIYLPYNQDMVIINLNAHDLWTERKYSHHSVPFYIVGLHRQLQSQKEQNKTQVVFNRVCSPTFKASVFLELFVT